MLWFTVKSLNVYGMFYDQRERLTTSLVENSVVQSAASVTLPAALLTTCLLKDWWIRNTKVNQIY